MEDIIIGFIILIAIKSETIGSDFAFLKWILYRKEYTDWYFSREKFKSRKENNLFKGKS